MIVKSGCKDLFKSNIYLYLYDKMGSRKAFKWLDEKYKKISWISSCDDSKPVFYVVDRIADWEIKRKRIRDNQYRYLK